MELIEIVERQVEIIHEQQRTIDRLANIIADLNKEQKVIVQPIEGNVGQMPWSRLKAELEKKYSVKNVTDKEVIIEDYDATASNEVKDK